MHGRKHIWIITILFLLLGISVYFNYTLKSAQSLKTIAYRECRDLEDKHNKEMNRLDQEFADNRAELMAMPDMTVDALITATQIYKDAIYDKSPYSKPFSFDDCQRRELYRLTSNP